MDAKQFAACAFLDIKSAFDAAWHPAILAALVDRNCPQYLVRIVSNFLENRTVRHSQTKVRLFTIT